MGLLSQLRTRLQSRYGSPYEGLAMDDAMDLPLRATSPNGAANPATRSSRRDTDWLDGLRGYAALLVFFTHFAFSYWHQVRFVYGTVVPVGAPIWPGEWYPYLSKDDDGQRRINSVAEQKNNYILQLPILRLIAYGEPMVVIFFIVSGYSLSLKPLSLIRKGRAAHAQIFTHLASSIFRRPIRLLGPVLISTLVVAICTSIGFYSHAASYANGDDELFHQYFKGWAHEWTPTRMDSFYLQMKDWLFSLSDLCDFFTHQQWPASRYDNHLWTIPVEFRCSMFLFLTHAATAMFSPRVRLTILSVFVLGGITWGDTWEMAVFWAGMALCEVNMAFSPASPIHQTNRSHSWLRRSGKTALLLLALYLASMPRSFTEYSSFYSGLAAYHIPGLRKDNQARFWQSMGCIIVVVIISRTHGLKRFFSNKAAKYLGRISFALYIVHGPMCRSLGYSTAIFMWQIFGQETNTRYNLAVIATALVVFPATFAASHLFCAFIDEPIVRAARALDARLKKHGPDQGPEWRPVPVEEMDDGGHDKESARVMVDSPMMHNSTSMA
ncbi:hypothetical protein K461DRAFT_95752 [Myriangium duriaei CBS 260.36]|uniref:Acyltransferase 3 domain-containing protein n=1 Tax=Myriangium duriaei CBS 260.36 TaxID=1168546 RepID=A0A9P4JAH9_9PEZI|nr:hypothetical protein K461DRAFT_95752 [Myriangium duriaei CBS 260.36]